MSNIRGASKRRLGRAFDILCIYHMEVWRGCQDRAERREPLKRYSPDVWKMLPQGVGGCWRRMRVPGHLAVLEGLPRQGLPETQVPFGGMVCRLKGRLAPLNLRWISLPIAFSHYRTTSGMPSIMLRQRGIATHSPHTRSSISPPRRISPCKVSHQLYGVLGSLNPPHSQPLRG